MLHENSSLNHKIENWIYVDAAARLAAAGFVAGDVGKLAYQIDERSYWRLLVTTPTWEYVGGGAPKSVAIPAGATANVDWTLAPTRFERLLTANTTLTHTNLVDDKVLIIPIRQDPASVYTLDWVGVDEWLTSGGTAPAPPALSKVVMFTFVRIGAKTYGSVAIQT